jgi:hypothetical protein
VIRVSVELTPKQFEAVARYARGLRYGGVRIKGDAADTVDTIACLIADAGKTQADAARVAAADRIRIAASQGVLIDV